MINDFLNKSPVFKPRIGVNLNQQSGEDCQREGFTGKEGGKKEKKKNRGKRTKRGEITLTGDCCFKSSLPAGGGGSNSEKKCVMCNGLGNSPFCKGTLLFCAHRYTALALPSSPSRSSTFGKTLLK